MKISDQIKGLPNPSPSKVENAFVVFVNGKFSHYTTRVVNGDFLAYIKEEMWDSNDNDKISFCEISNKYIVILNGELDV